MTSFTMFISIQNPYKLRKNTSNFDIHSIRTKNDDFCLDVTGSFTSKVSKISFTISR